MNNVSNIQCIEMVFLQSAFVHEYSNLASVQNVCDTHCTNTALACHHVDHQWCHIYQYHQLLSQASSYSLYVHTPHTHTLLKPAEPYHPETSNNKKTVYEQTKQKVINLLTTEEQCIVFTARCYASAVLAMGLCLSVCHKLEFYPGSPPTEAPNAGGVGQNRRLSTNNRLYLENGTR